MTRKDLIDIIVWGVLIASSIIGYGIVVICCKFFSGL